MTLLRLFCLLTGGHGPGRKRVVVLDQWTDGLGTLRQCMWCGEFGKGVGE